MNQISICILCWLHPDSWCLNPSLLAKHPTSRGRNRDQDGYSRDCGEFSERPGDCFGDQSGVLGIPTCWICIWWNIGWVWRDAPAKHEVYEVSAKRSEMSKGGLMVFFASCRIFAIFPTEAASKFPEDLGAGCVSSLVRSVTFWAIQM